MKKIKSSLWRNAMLVLALFFFGLVLYSSRQDLNKTWLLLKNVSLVMALLLPLLQLISYFLVSNYYRSFLSVFGSNISAARAFASTTALNFVNQILPSGGASGTTYLIYAFKDVAKPGELTLIQLGRYLFAFLTYAPLLVVAYVWLLIEGNLNHQLEVALLALFIIALPGTVLLIAAIRNQSLVDRLVSAVLRFINRVVGLFTRRPHTIEVSRSRGFLKEFSNGAEFIRSQRGNLLKPYLFMQLSTLVEVSIVATAFFVLGVSVNPAAILVAFTAANIAGAISIIPGDVGVHELAVITVLSYIGVDQGTAIAGTLLYRVFNKLIVMAIGFGFYVKLIRPLIKNARANT
ncbi:MAG TPA: flippase-like domain-containing protein [Candidatus Saccharimonadales bacterium]